MEKSDLTYRMYGLVPYNISPIQQGIQFGHGVVEYMLSYGSNKECEIWSKRDKTFIVLNGGTTNNNPNCLGTLNLHLKTLLENGIEVSTFYEPDLGDQLTSINFIVDERVFDRIKYPDFTFNYGTFQTDTLDIVIGQPKQIKNTIVEMLQSDEYGKEWSERIGGPKNFFLREFLKTFRKA
jgi:hypothetical protein